MTVLGFPYPVFDDSSLVSGENHGGKGGKLTADSAAVFQLIPTPRFRTTGYVRVGWQDLLDRALPRRGGKAECRG